MSERPWHHEGLRFRCAGCGGCCTGDPGYVWVNKAEIQELAEAVDLQIAAFQKAFLRRVGRRWSLVELPSGDCIFYERIKRRCKVYQVRPRQCRTWPFWASNIRTPADWDATCRECPGAGRGPIVSGAEIQDRKSTIRV